MGSHLAAVHPAPSSDFRIEEAEDDGFNDIHNTAGKDMATMTHLASE